jgi:large subunit ribosomal protein L10
MSEQRQILQEKAKEVEGRAGLIEQYKAIGLADLQKVRASQLQELRKKLHDVAHLRVIKNTLFKRAINESKGKPDLDQLEEHLTGSRIVLFTNLNPFKLLIILERSKVKTTAKAGDVAAFDVVVPAGNTGQPPGPIISQLGAVGLKTRIESGSVWINKDTLVVKEGETISARLAPLLSKLGIKPVEAGLDLTVVYDDGTLITEDKLHVDLEQTQRSVEDAHRHALYLSVNSAYTTSDNIELLLQKASQDAYSLSVNGTLPTKKTVAAILSKAYTQALCLQGGLNTAEEKAQKG